MNPDGANGDLLSISTTQTFKQQLPATSAGRYKGKTVMLMDERTMSQAEHTGLFFEAANGTKFTGSPTAGANGDVTSVVLPGDISIHFTGQSVRHVDGRQLQRLGLTPDVPAAPTIAGIRAGRDEVLEKAIEYLNEELK
jgi:C-terminal processing protease CtpA/Prc